MSLKESTYLEGDRRRVGVPDLENLGNLSGKRSCDILSASRVFSPLHPMRWYDDDVRWKPSSTGSISTDMITGAESSWYSRYAGLGGDLAELCRDVGRASSTRSTGSQYRAIGLLGCCRAGKSVRVAGSGFCQMLRRGRREPRCAVVTFLLMRDSWGEPMRQDGSC